MTGQAIQYIEKLKGFAQEGLTYGEAAARLDLCVPYVKRIAKANCIILASRSDTRVDQVRALAVQGLTRQQAARQLGVAYGTVVRCAIANNIFFKRPRLAAPSVRTRQMAALFQSGKTLQEIGDQYGITRERVRQIIEKYHGLKGRDGGASKTAAERRVKFAATRNARSLAKWGCNFDQYRALRDMKTPTRAYASQRNNARKRDIGWELNLWQWWSIWQQSGKWTQRGRGNKYMMCRTNDVGPYAVGNVFIATGCENSSREHTKTSGLPRGVSRKNNSYIAHRCINGKQIYLGAHPTPELAHAAYLAAGDAQ